MSESRERIQEVEAYRFSLNKQIEHLMYGQKTVRIEHLAHILGATEFLQVDKKGITFQIKAYVDAKVAEYVQTHIQLQLPREVAMVQGVVFPAGEGRIETGSGAGVEEKRTFERNKFFIELLSQHTIPYDLKPSLTTKRMMRGEGYTVYFLPDLNKTVCVDNEEGNTTIILFDTPSYEDAAEVFLHYTKDQIRNEQQERAVCVDWDDSYTEDPNKWKQRIYEILQQSAPIVQPKKAAAPHTPQETKEPVFSSKKKKRIAELERAFAVWKEQQEGLPEEKQKKFNGKWLNKNGFSGLDAWARTNGGIEALVVMASEAVQKSFEKREATNRTPQTALLELEQAHVAWKTQQAALPKEKRGKFNGRWLEKNGFSGLGAWARTNGGIEALVVMASEAVQKSFKKREQTKTPEMTLLELEQAYVAWKTQQAAFPEEKRRKFNINWLNKNGFSGLDAWTRANGGIIAFVANASDEIQQAFSFGNK